MLSMVKHSSVKLSSHPVTARFFARALGTSKPSARAAAMAEPLAGITVTYGTHEVTGGVELSKSQTASAPSVSIAADDSKLVTLLMTDPDAPSHADPRMAEWLHWMVVNIEKGDLSSGHEVMPYAGPTPPAGTGKHRYIFTIYEQTSKLSVQAPSSRAKFDSAKWAKSHHLKSLATTHFTCQTH